MFLLINKPKGWTSHDVVNRIRKLTGINKVGHGGTLDPNATGLLILGIGRESTKKLSNSLLHNDKVYVAEIVLGEERDTDDAEGNIRTKDLKDLTAAKLQEVKLPNIQIIRKVLRSFVGEQMQIPPDYSAVKIKGKEAFKLARAGKVFKLEPRSVKIHSIDLISYKYPLLVIEVSVSSGTYIRSLARDFGKKLQTGAYLANLQRIRVGNSLLSEALSLDKFTEDNWKDYTVNFENK